MSYSYRYLHIVNDLWTFSMCIHCYRYIIWVMIIMTYYVLVNALARVFYGNYWARESSRRSCSRRRSRVLHELQELSRERRKTSRQVYIQENMGSDLRQRAQFWKRDSRRDQSKTGPQLCAWRMAGHKSLKALRVYRNQLGSASNLEHLLIRFSWLKTKSTLILCHLSKSQCSLLVQLAPVLVPVFLEPFSSSLASLAALSTFTS